MNIRNKYRSILVFYGTCIFVAMVIFAYFEVENHFLKGLIFHKKPAYPYSYKKCESVSNLDHKNILYLKFFIPCKDKRYDKLLGREIPKIKHIINMQITPPMKGMIAAGELSAFKKALVITLNQNLDISIEDVYFEEIQRVPTGSGF